MKTGQWSHLHCTVIIPSSRTIRKRRRISICHHEIKQASFPSGTYKTLETVTESTLPPMSMSNCTEPMCVTCKHVPPPTVRLTWQRIVSTRWEKSAVIWKEAPVSNMCTANVISLAVLNAEPAGIVVGGLGREDVIKATPSSYSSLTVGLVR